MKFDLKQILVGLSILVVGFLIGYISFSLNTPSGQETSGELQDTNDATLRPHISPLLACNNPENLTNGELRDIESALEQLIQKKKADGTLTTASVYFRDLNNGPWFGVNMRERFAAASLLKLPLLISFYKYAEKNPDVFTLEVDYTKRLLDVSQYEKPEQELELGKVYTVRELLEHMIKYSDNEAASILYQIIDKNDLINSYKDLALELPEPNIDYQINVREYASFLRILYNATYLTKDSSEEALVTLTKSSFINGLVAGVPAGVQVAHKFGERTFAENTNIKQLHDCGIIYAPKKPYLLCIMTRGADYEKLENVIREMSSIVYNKVVQ